MLSVSNKVKEAYVNGTAETSLFFDVIKGDGTTVTYSPTNILAGSVSITESLCSSDQFDVSRVEKNELAFTLFNITENISDLVGSTVTARHRLTFGDGTTADVPLGVFVIVDAVHDGDYLYKCTAYDTVGNALDTIIDDWWNNTVTFPITLRDLVIALFTHLGINHRTPTTFTNYDFSIEERTTFFEGITGTELLGYIQEVAGGFFKTDRYGVVQFKSISSIQSLVPHVGLYPHNGLYPNAGTVFIGDSADANQDYNYRQVVSNLVIADYKVETVTKLQVRGTEDDVGIIVGTGDNAYVIQGNPLLYNLTDTSGRSIVEAIFNSIRKITYIPFSGKLMGLPFVEVGDAVSVSTLNEKTAKSPLFHRVLSGSRLVFDTFTCNGAQEFEEVTSVNRYLKSVNQRTHEIINTVDELSSTVTRVETEIGGQVEKNTTAIQQNATNITIQAQRTSYITNYLLNSNFTNYESRLKYWVSDTGSYIDDSAATIEYVDDADFWKANGKALKITKTSTEKSWLRVQTLQMNGQNLKGKKVAVFFSYKVLETSNPDYPLVFRWRYKATGSSTYTNIAYNYIGGGTVGQIRDKMIPWSPTEDTYVDELEISIPYAFYQTTTTYEVNNMCLTIQDGADEYFPTGTWADSARVDAVSQINVSPDGVKIQGEKIDIKGITTFSSSSSGTTVIDGGTVNLTNLNASNITTGTLSGNYISGGSIKGVTIEAQSKMIWNYTNRDSTTGTVTATVGTTTTQLTANSPQTWYGMIFNGSKTGGSDYGSGTKEQDDSIIFNNKNFVVSSSQMALESRYGTYTGANRCGIISANLNTASSTRLILMCSTSSGSSRITLLPNKIEMNFGGTTRALVGWTTVNGVLVPYADS